MSFFMGYSSSSHWLLICDYFQELPDLEDVVVSEFPPEEEIFFQKVTFSLIPVISLISSNETSLNTFTKVLQNEDNLSCEMLGDAIIYAFII